MTRSADDLMANARKQFAVNGAPWDERTEAAVRSLIAIHLMDVARLTMPPLVAASMRVDTQAALDAECKASRGASARISRQCLAWLDERYDSEGRPR